MSQRQWKLYARFIFSSGQRTELNRTYWLVSNWYQPICPIQLWTLTKDIPDQTNRELLKQMSCNQAKRLFMRFMSWQQLEDKQCHRRRGKLHPATSLFVLRRQTSTLALAIVFKYISCPARFSELNLAQHDLTVVTLSAYNAAKTKTYPAYVLREQHLHTT